ncbi:hypothetical protein TIFTF001_028738 [Ficus carica]|uniref:Uncharacterized protein n=1 Tax=Ficus carica TaxID=3494 RepID=A0AA88DQW7_FICCA|nr:hypothetical protein TIFTF001_028738 [Ficus carica]
MSLSALALFRIKLDDSSPRHQTNWNLNWFVSIPCSLDVFITSSPRLPRRGVPTPPSESFAASILCEPPTAHIKSSSASRATHRELAVGHKNRDLFDSLATQSKFLAASITTLSMSLGGQGVGKERKKNINGRDKDSGDIVETH